MAKSGFGAAEAAVEQAQASQKIDYAKFSVKENEEPKRVRFLVLDGDDSVQTFTEHWTEFNNTWKRNFACPNEEITDTNCVVCAGKRGADFAKDQRKNSHLLNLIDRTDGVTKVWKFSPMAMAILLENLKAHGNISDRDYLVQFIKNEDENVKAKFLYVIQPATDKAVALTAADKEAAEGRYNLAKLIPAYDGENLARIMKLTPEQSVKGAGAGAKAGTTASSFLDSIGAAKPDLMAQFTSIVSADKPAEAEAASSDEAAAEFQDLLKTMNS